MEAVRRDLFGPRRRITRLDAPELRDVVREKLVDALNEVEALAKKSGRKTRKGEGGVPPKARWYQLMSYIAQILDGVLRNVELSEVREKLEGLERTVDELQKETQQTTG